jgi:hypothetical protein
MLCPFDPALDRDKFEDWCRDHLARYPDPAPKRRGRKARPKKPDTKICVLDFETDPFGGPSAGPVRPFAVGYYDGVIYRTHWGADCAERVVQWIREEEEPVTVYAHNGGRFDFMFLLPWIEQDIFVINRRIVKAQIVAGDITHTLVDSMGILPIPLKDAAAKGKFDYANMHRSKREKHRDAINAYLKQDCVALYDVIIKHRAALGNGLTMAGIAIRKLKQAMKPAGVKAFQVYDRLTEERDTYFRKFYYGGRVECFERGIIPGDWKIYDINSSYPNVMATYNHPVGQNFEYGIREINENTDFAVIDATSEGSLPIRHPETGMLVFPHGRFTFHATGHEIRAALELGLLEIHDIISSATCSRRTNFKAFVDKYYQMRMDAKKEGNEDFVLFWKLTLNSSYGKFSQNPREFRDYLLVRPSDDTPDTERWTASVMGEVCDIYERKLIESNDPADRRNFESAFHNVATGASITGAARAELLRGMQKAKRIVYCDTDSVICESMQTDHDPKRLGAWKLECRGHTVAIVDKKTYCLIGDVALDAETQYERMKNYGDTACVKLASKGVRLTAGDVWRAAEGETVTHVKEAPTFALTGAQRWITRRVRRTDLAPQKQAKKILVG